jgi:hypothetical protein
MEFAIMEKLVLVAQLIVVQHLHLLRLQDPDPFR